MICTACKCFVLLAFSLLLCGWKPAFAASDAEFQRLLSAPDDPQLNRQFAAAAEERGELRHALAALERALNASPGDRELLAEYARLRNRILPSMTSVTMQVGGSYGSNPRQVHGSSSRKTDDRILDAAVAVEDERTFGGMRIRSLAIATGQWEPEASELSSGQLIIQSGPVFLLSPETWLHVAPGVSVAWLDRQQVYSEASGAATIGTVFRGLTQTVTARYGWREGNGDVSYSDAQILEILGRFVVTPNLLHGDYVYLEPRYRVSRPDGNEPTSLILPTVLGPATLVSRDVSPSDYEEWGGRISYFFPVAQRRVWLGAGLSVLERQFNSLVLDPEALSAGVQVATDRSRRDVYFEPTAHIIFPDLIAPGVDVRADYRLEDNQSNDDYRDFINHVAGVRIVGRF